MENIIASLDIGDNTLKLITAEISENKINILNVSEVPSKGLKNGIIIVVPVWSPVNGLILKTFKKSTISA